MVSVAKLQEEDLPPMTKCPEDGGKVRHDFQDPKLEAAKDIEEGEDAVRLAHAVTPQSVTTAEAASPYPWNNCDEVLSHAEVTCELSFA
eukprot:g21630.t1